MTSTSTPSVYQPNHRRWASRWFSPEREQTKSSQATCTSTSAPTPRKCKQSSRTRSGTRLRENERYPSICSETRDCEKRYTHRTAPIGFELFHVLSSIPSCCIIITFVFILTLNASNTSRHFQCPSQLRLLESEQEYVSLGRGG